MTAPVVPPRPARVGHAAAVGLLTLVALGCGASHEGELAQLREENEELRARLSSVEQAQVAEVREVALEAPTAWEAGDWSWGEPSAGPERSPRELPPPPPVREPEPPPPPRPSPPRSIPEPVRQQPTTPPPPPVDSEPPVVLEQEPVPELTPDPDPDPGPVPEPRVAAAGTPMLLALDAEIHSGRAQVGAPLSARLTADLRDPSGRVVLPAGTRITGRITEARAAKKLKRKSILAFRFETAELPGGETVPLSAGRRLEGRGYTKKDGAVMGGSAAGGAVLGQVLGGDSEATATGAILGGAIGSAVVLSKRGEDVVLPAGTELELLLDTDLKA